MKQIIFTFSEWQTDGWSDILKDCISLSADTENKHAVTLMVDDDGFERAAKIIASEAVHNFLREVSFAICSNGIEIIDDQERMLVTDRLWIKGSPEEAKKLIDDLFENEYIMT